MIHLHLHSGSCLRSKYCLLMGQNYFYISYHEILIQVLRLNQVYPLSLLPTRHSHSRFYNYFHRLVSGRKLAYLVLIKPFYSRSVEPSFVGKEVTFLHRLVYHRSYKIILSWKTIALFYRLFHPCSIEPLFHIPSVHASGSMQSVCLVS